METAQYFKANLVVLLVSSDLTPIDENGRLQLASVVLEMAGKQGFPLEQLYLDPVISCRQDPASWALSGGLPDINLILESIRLLGELGGPGLQTIVALSNASLCLAGEKRSAFHCYILPLLADAGLSAVILNCRDQQLMTVAGELQMTKAA
jgi:cobalamin-dependent methionine synthase I